MPLGSEPPVQLTAGVAVELAQGGLGTMRAAKAESTVEPAAIAASVLLAGNRGRKERRCETHRRHDEENENDGR